MRRRFRRVIVTIRDLPDALRLGTVTMSSERRGKAPEIKMAAGTARCIRKGEMSPLRFTPKRASFWRLARLEDLPKQFPLAVTAP